jgi:hypothetical protein
MKKYIICSNRINFNHAFFAQISSVQVDELVNRTIKLLMFQDCGGNR